MDPPYGLGLRWNWIWNCHSTGKNAKFSGQKAASVVWTRAMSHWYGTYLTSFPVSCDMRNTAGPFDMLHVQRIVAS